MAKKKEMLDLREYVTAHDAAQLLSIANERPIRAEYVHQMARMPKHTIRTYPLHGRYLYHRADIMACRIHPSIACKATDNRVNAKRTRQRVQKTVPAKIGG